MRRCCSFLWRFLPETVAVLAFLGTAFGLWWYMQPRPTISIDLPQEGSRVDRALYSPDGKYLAAVHSEAWLHVFDTETGNRVWSFQNEGKRRIPPEYLRWTREHHLFFATTDEMEGRQWQVLGVKVDQGPEFIYRSDLIHAPKGAVWPYFEVSPDGRSLALRTEPNDRLSIIDLPSGKVRRTYDKGWVLRECFSPDSSRLLLGLVNPLHCVGFPWFDFTFGTMLQDTSDGKCYQFIPAEPNTVIGAPDTRWEYAFSEDGKLLAWGAKGRVDLFDPCSGKLVKRLNLLESATAFSATEAWGLSLDWVPYVRFDNANQWLVVVATPRMSIEGPPRDPFEIFPWAGEATVLIFELRDYRLIHMSTNSCLPVLTSDFRYMATKTKLGQHGVRIVDLKQDGNQVACIADEITWPHGLLAYAPSETGTGVFVYETEASQKPASWLLWFQSCFGIPQQRQYGGQVHFLDPASGRKTDEWSFSCLEMKCQLSPTGKQLLVVQRLPEGARIEFYNLPASRPWFHILGWAFLVGLAIELLGRSRWQWRRRSVKS